MKERKGDVRKAFEQSSSRVGDAECPPLAMDVGVSGNGAVFGL